ncbi:MAG: YbaB/EbfC family nucleoid-associated protein [Desulfovibrio sp.]|uniref:YbaB/EbfC family nucleoid-associated protein n=1 Tax=Desulfovibrio sp. TaxID=885 RepID=UPI001A6BF5D5|nr:YbaB/EbfC family nucleoid-associated protein [Desulfovibrio sp.]MBD5416260.1 YbaB/EbfC family nucleoid-associated protein [Desulfovibrio sp.]MDE6735361.1 YbaB/EbfC family nucleoid-associated protein [Desulfovibrio sp.]
MRNMNDILRQAQVMQNKLAKLQQEMAERTYEAASGGGMVKAEVSGKQELRKLVIDPKALEGGDVEMLQDLILAAVNEASRIARESMEREMNAISGGIKLPGMF